LRSSGCELAHPIGTFLDQHFDSGCVAQCGASCKGVYPMKLRRVAGSQRGGDATLRVRGGAIEKRALGENDHFTRIGGSPRGVQSCDSAPNHQETSANALRHVRKIATRASRRSSDDARTAALCSAN
jgi:hypothetical protein